MVKACSKCGEIHERSHRYCLYCHNAYMREWRKTHPLNAEQRWKDNARSHAGMALRRGQIERKPCKICGEYAQMHHEDYNKPLDVVWMCRECHMDHHKAVNGGIVHRGTLRNGA